MSDSRIMRALENARDAFLYLNAAKAHEHAGENATEALTLTLHALDEARNHVEQAIKHQANTEPSGAEADDA